MNVDRAKFAAGCAATGIVGILLCVACSLADPDMSEYTCTDAEMARVQSDTKFCSTNTQFNGAQCYRVAIAQNCQLKIKPASMTIIDQKSKQ